MESPVSRLRDRDSEFPRGFDLPALGDEHFGQGLLRSVAEGGAVLEVGQVGDVAGVLVALEDVEVVVLHQPMGWLLSGGGGAGR